MDVQNVFIFIENIFSAKSTLILYDEIWLKFRSLNIQLQLC